MCFWKGITLVLYIQLTVGDASIAATSTPNTTWSKSTSIAKKNISSVTENCTIANGSITATLRVNKSYDISHCIECFCHSNKTVSCFQRDFQKSTTIICSNCSRFPQVPCSFCVAPDKSLKSNNIQWRLNEFKCVVCECTLGVIKCKYPVEIVFSNGNSMSFKKLCVGETCLEDIHQIRKKKINYKCTICKDDNVTYYNYGWSRLIGDLQIPCSCTNRGIICQSYFEIERIFFRATCKNCTKERAVDTFTKKGCTFQGLKFQHGDFKFVSVAGVVICLKCACYLGNLQCVYEHNKRIETCHGVKECTKLAKNPDVKANCTNRNMLTCPLQPISWESNGCHYTCFKARLSIVYKQFPWCQKLVTTEFCANCPDRSAFISNYTDVIFQCASGEFIWKDRVCNRRSDCQDSSDEQNCTSYQCSTKVSDAGIVWRASPVNTTLHVDCKLISTALEGSVSRKCLIGDHSGTRWEGEDACGCVNGNISMLLKKVVASIQNMTLLELKNTITNFYNYTRETQNHIEIVNGSIGVLVEAKEMYRYNINISGTSELVKDLLDFGYGIYHTYSLCHDGNTEQAKTRLAQVLEEVSEMYSVVSTKKHVMTTNYVSLVKTLDPIDELIAELEKRQLKYGTNGETENSKKEVSKIIFESYHRKIIVILEDVMTAVSIAALVTALILYKILKIRNTTKVIIHKNLTVVFLLNQILQKLPSWLFNNLQDDSKTVCVTILVMSYYFTLATFAWMMAEGINLALLVTVVFERKKRLSEMLVTGYGLPFVITLSVLICSTSSFVDTKNCITMSGSLWLLKTPMAVILTVNTCLFAAILVVICKRKQIMASKNGSTRTGISIKAFVVLLPLLGLTYITGLFIEYSPIYLGYVYVCCNGLMGLFLLILHCLMDPKVKTNLTSYWSRRSTIRKSTRNSSVVKR